MPTNEVTTVRNAVVALLSADATMRTLCGRTGGIVVPWGTVASAKRPVLAYLLSSNAGIGGAGNRRSVQVFLGAFAQGNGAMDTVEALTRRAREVLTHTAFMTQGLDAIVITADERAGGETEDGTISQDARHDCDLTLLLTAPL